MIVGRNGLVQDGQLHQFLEHSRRRAGPASQCVKNVKGRIQSATYTERVMRRLSGHEGSAVTVWVGLSSE